MKIGGKRKLDIMDSSASVSSSGSLSSGEDDERTIPFLRRLVDMIEENEDTISFYPGDADGSLARIIVHDRVKIERDVLPRYFNHSSFASLRRQLNYFNFARVGRGRQRGAQYVNENVVKLDDILRLKRREVGSPQPIVRIIQNHKLVKEKFPISLDLTVGQSHITYSNKGDLVLPHDDLFACNVLLAMSCNRILQQTS